MSERSEEMEGRWWGRLTFSTPATAALNFSASARQSSGFCRCSLRKRAPKSVGEGGRNRGGKGDGPEAAREGLLARVDRLPLVRLGALALEPERALLEPLEVLEQTRRVAQALVRSLGLRAVLRCGGVGVAFAVEVLALEGALDLFADLLLLLAELGEFGGDALLDVDVEGLLARGGHGGRGLARGGSGRELVDQRLGELLRGVSMRVYGVGRVRGGLALTGCWREAKKVWSSPDADCSWSGLDPWAPILTVLYTLCGSVCVRAPGSEPVSGPETRSVARKHLRTWESLRFTAILEERRS